MYKQTTAKKVCKTTLGIILIPIVFTILTLVLVPKMLGVYFNII